MGSLVRTFAVGLLLMAAPLAAAAEAERMLMARIFTQITPIVADHVPDGLAGAAGVITLAAHAAETAPNTPDDDQGVRFGPGVYIPMAILVLGLGILAGRLVLRSRADRPGTAAYLGRTVEVRSDENGRERAFVDGAWWAVRSTGPRLRVGQLARVVAVDGATLVVRPVESA
jgi:membrane-bound ClpP family serine protease